MGTILAVWMSWTTGSAWAEEPAPPPPPPEPAPAAEVGDEPPLAIPVDSPPPVPDPAPSERALPPRADRVRDYRGQALSIRHFTESYVSTTYAYGYHRRWWGGYGRWGVFAVPVLVHEDAWGVFQGNTRLDVPQTLGALGDAEGKVALERRIKTNKALGTTGYALGLGGLAASVVGFVGRDQATSTESFVGWTNVALTGLGFTVGGLIGGAITSGRAERLQFDHEATVAIDTLETQIREHNAALADDLGLTPGEAARIELGPGAGGPRPRRR